MPLLLVLAAVLLLLLLIIVFKLNAFLALVTVAIALGLAEGMPPKVVLSSIQTGIGSMLGSIVMILGFGAMLGSLLIESGAVQRVTYQLIATFGVRHIQWAVMLTGFLVGLPMYYMAGFVLLIPLVFAVAASTRLPLLYVGLPLVASLSVTHGYLPPHPGPTAIAVLFKADVSLTLLYGLVVAVPAVIIAGPVFSRFVKRYNPAPPPGLALPKEFTDAEMPGFGISLLTVLTPVLLMALGVAASLTLPAASAFRQGIEFISDPNLAMLLSVVVAILTLGVGRGKKLQQVMDSVSGSVSSIAMMLLIIGGGGALKQVLVDSGVGTYIVSQFNDLQLSPLLMAWLVAAILRICIGSSTVAALTAGGVMVPLLATTAVKPELMVLAVGAGSLVCSHVNDSGFWVFKEYFNLTIPQTLATWTVMETLVSVVGLVGVLLLNTVV
ncbi:gluconate permease [Hymenobacter sp. BT186]|uniref:Gluconate permease n=1 Tax=Hymenobacter telluris TaxID=2816474 RepID=A0A939EVI3_9BACT|nr:gluconate:H+ symporter [Hymenobacter telluris]MBO0357991.1 gluconate permease [Hymenobacter telluris]MBW3374018.1 gluconate:H+ symporter [Hymenobacter norwichensis]